MSFTELTLSTAFMGSNPLGTYNLSHPPPSTPLRTSRTKQKWPPEPSKNVWLPPRHRYHRIFQRWPSPLLSLLRLLRYPTFPHTLFSLPPFPLASNLLLQYIILSRLFPSVLCVSLIIGWEPNCNTANGAVILIPLVVATSLWDMNMGEDLGSVISQLVFGDRRLG